MKTQFAHILPTIDAILKSPAVVEYVIGITATPAQRRRSYRDAIDHRYSHFVILTTNLAGRTADQLEEDIQNAVFSDARSRAFKKYDPTRRGKPYKRSRGGSSKYANIPAYSLYLAFRDTPRDGSPRLTGNRSW